MVGTLIKTIPQDELFIGLVYDWRYDDDDGYGTVRVEIKWNDCDDTTEIFHEYEDYDVSEYHFYHKGRWWEIHQNFWKFKQVLEGK
jgi:hypothetical protein